METFGKQPGTVGKPFDAFVYNEDIRAKYLTCVKDEVARNIISPLNKCTKQTLSSGEIDIDHAN